MKQLTVKDLMVGDWVIPHVFDSTLEPSKIVGIYYNSYKGKDNVDWVDCEVWDELSLKDIEPIPLTPEILEKNGMHLYNRKTNSLMEECNHSDTFKEDYNYRVELSLDHDGTIRWTINGDEYTIMPLDYVHQLQQALRLCGIDKTIEL